MNNLGIDTVTLVTTDFTFDVGTNLLSDYPLLLGDIPRLLGTKIEKEPLLVDVNGNIIEGDFLKPQKAIRNTGVLQIQKMGMEQIPSLKIQISIPKFLSGENYLLAEKSDIKTCYSELNDELKRMGINCDMSKAKVARQDVTKNINSDYPPNMYIPVFRALSASRMRDQEHLGETYTKMNGTREICFYDKRREMMDNNENVSKLPKNVLRSEYRIKKTNSVIKTYNVNSFSDVYKNYDDIKGLYSEQLKKLMFKSPYLDFDKTDDVMQIMWNCMENSGKGKANFYEQGILQILCNQQKAIIENISSEKVVELYGEYLENKGYSKDNIRKMKSRQRIKIRQINEKMFCCMNISPTVTMQDLYNELYTKLVA